MKRVVVGIISRLNKNGDAEYLLVSSRRPMFGKYSGAYYPPGGHIEVDETEEQALVRELKEELKLDVRPVARLAESPGDVKDQITYWWRCDVTSGELQRDKSELADAGYFTRKKMANLRLWPATKRFFDRFIFID